MRKPCLNPAEAVLLALLAVLSLPSVAQGQRRPVYQDAPAPTQGVLVPARSVADDDGATGLTTNPALLPLGGRLSAVFIDSELDDQGRRIGQGTALLLSSRLIGLFAAGVGFEWLRPPDFTRIGGYGKLTFGFAYGGRTASFGFNVARYFSSHDVTAEDLDGLVTLDVGLLVRPLKYVSFGAVVHDLAQPRFRNVPLQRVWELGLQLRPFGTQLLTVGGELRIGERRGDYDPRVRLTFTPWPGISLRGDVEFYRRLEAPLGVTPVPGRDTDVRATVGLEVTLDRFTLGGYAIVGQNGLDRRTGVGGSAVVRAQLDLQPALKVGPLEVPELVLHGSYDEVRFVPVAAYLHRLREDDRVRAVLLKIEPGLGMTWAQLQEVRALIARLQKAGKKVYAYAEVLGGKGYLLAVACDRIYLNPGGGVRLVGLGTGSLYFKGTLDKLGVRAQFVKIGEFKSAPEAFTRTGPSDPARQQRAAILDDLYGILVDGIARGRGLGEAGARQAIDQGPYLAEESTQARLVDELKRHDELAKALAAQLGRKVRLARHKEPPPRVTADWAVPHSVAIIHVEGDMTDGKSQEIPLLGIRTAGAETIVKAIKTAREDATVKAIVLRLNTPGGSAYAAEIIYQELWRTRGKKPLIASMGGIAASAGYYIAAACDQIIAEPGTITGSIGIFTGKVDVRGLLDKVGISVEESQRGKHALMDSLYRSYSPEELKVVTQKIEALYLRFLDRVSQGRKVPRVEIDKVARGRVWTGQRALGLKLVDRLGGLMDAVLEAKGRAGLGNRDRVQLRLLPVSDDSLVNRLIKAVLPGLRGGVASAVRSELGGGVLPPALLEVARALLPATLYPASTPLYRLPFGWLIEP